MMSVRGITIQGEGVREWVRVTEAEGAEVYVTVMLYVRLTLYDRGGGGEGEKVKEGNCIISSRPDGGVRRSVSGRGWDNE